MATTLRDIDERVAGIDAEFQFETIFELLRAYDFPKSTVTRLEKGQGNLDKSPHDNELWWRDKVFYRFESGVTSDEMLELITQMEAQAGLDKVPPRFLVVASEDHLLAKDTKTGDTLDITSKQLINNTAFFAPWAKIEKTAIENANVADLKAAAKMAKLYEEIEKKNQIETAEEVHALNVFFARLLFCFFAEDTGVFGEDAESIFTNAIGSLTQASGEDLGQVLEDLFEVMDTPINEREGVPTHFAEFGYVNGSLFSERTKTPVFTAKSRAIILECGELRWDEINPDIFGSMIQAVVTSSTRSNLGMHYTSVENIMKVLRPLFLDELEEEFAAASESIGKLNKLLDRIANIKVFDPACGSGNFLIIAYKKLRHLEHEILKQIHQLEAGELSAGMSQTLFPDPRVKLENFYGIEIDDFASGIATLSLWLAKHQMNLEFRSMFDRMLPLIPLRDHGNIMCGNATRLDWEAICPPDEGEVFICGNPPYLGSSMQSASNKQEFIDYFKSKSYPKNLDYISLWFFKGAEFVGGTRSALAFVSTSSVCQGDHVALMWPRVFASEVEIDFAHEPFKWSNSAKANAGVVCIVVGLRSKPRHIRIFDGHSSREVARIGPYLRPDPNRTVVESSRKPLNGMPPIVRGSQPSDGGNLILSPVDAESLLASYPDAARFVRTYVGGDEFVNGKRRFCLWVNDGDAGDARKIPPIAERFEKVTAMRLNGSSAARAMAASPHRFAQRPHKDSPAIIIPRVTSDRRDYVPMGFLDPGTVISDLGNAVYDADPWVFGLLQSRMHQLWMRTVGGRMGTGIRYSAVLCYNTFPVPPLKDKNKDRLTEGATKVLATREQFSGKTLAELYDPDKMPDALREAHNELDEIVDRIYQPRRPFASDEARLERLFMMYAKATGKASSETLEQLALLDE